MKLAENAEETKLLLERKEELEKALLSTQFPLEVASSCLSYREKRTGPDVVHDDVEIGLVKVSIRLTIGSAVRTLILLCCNMQCLLHAQLLSILKTSSDFHHHYAYVWYSGLHYSGKNNQVILQNLNMPMCLHR